MRFSFAILLLLSVAPCLTRAPLHAQNTSITQQKQEAQSAIAKAKIVELNAQIAQNPNRAALYFERAQQWEQVIVKGFEFDEVGDMEKARADYLKAIEFDPKFGQARAHLTRLQMESARELMNQARAEKAKTYQEPTQVAAVSQQLETAIRDAPTYAPPYAWLARWEVARISNLRVSLYAGSSESVFAGFADTNPVLIESRMKRALELALGAKTRDVQLTRTFPLDVYPAASQLINYLRAQNAPARALPLAEALAVLNDRNAFDQAMVGQIRLELNDPKNAMPDIDRAIALQEKIVAAIGAKAEEKAVMAQFYGLRAQTRLALNQATQDEAAMLDLEKAVLLAPTNAHLYQVLRAQVFLKQNAVEKALSELNLAAQNQLFYAPTFAMRAAILRALKRIPEAEADEKQLLKIEASEKEAARIRAQNPQ